MHSHSSLGQAGLLLEEETAPQDTITLLVCTDNHLGYCEKDQIRCNDSFEAFEEMLQIAKRERADAVLHAGDLFHENKPSRKTLNNCISLLRRYCLGDDPCYLQFQSDAKENFSGDFCSANFNDPNINISLPIFAIHGNHDDPAGDGNLSAWNILAQARLVNYFGRVKDVDEISMAPVLLQKGNTRLALYGIGNIRDERLHRTFTSKRVLFGRLCNQAATWFNLLMLHQNRIPHGPTNHIPIDFLDPMFNLIVWGHEHEPLIEPEFCSAKNFYITQPGSSVATSLCEAESAPKCAALIKICNGRFRVDRIPLTSSREIILRDVSLLAHFPNPITTGNDQIYEFLGDQVRSLLGAAHSKKLPLVRLRVDCSGGFPPINVQSFGQQFFNQVANPRDLLLFTRRRNPQGQKSESHSQEEAAHSLDLEQLVRESLTSQNLQVFPSTLLYEKFRTLVEKDDTDGLKNFVKSYLGSLIENIRNSSNINELGDELARAKYIEMSMDKSLKAAGPENAPNSGVPIKRGRGGGVKRSLKK